MKFLVVGLLSTVGFVGAAAHNNPPGHASEPGHHVHNLLDPIPEELAKLGFHYKANRGKDKVYKTEADYELKIRGSGNDILLDISGPIHGARRELRFCFSDEGEIRNVTEIYELPYRRASILAYNIKDVDKYIREKHANFPAAVQKIIQKVRIYVMNAAEKRKHDSGEMTKGAED